MTLFVPLAEGRVAAFGWANGPALGFTVFKDSGQGDPEDDAPGRDAGGEMPKARCTVRETADFILQVVRQWGGASVRVGGFDAPTREAWIAIQGLDEDVANNGPQEAASIRKVVPANYVAIASECESDEEERVFDALVKAFPRGGVLVSTYAKGGEYLVPKPVSRGGLSCFVLGDMTWVIFIDPVALRAVVSKEVA